MTEKSSEEILQELFYLCQQTPTAIKTEKVEETIPQSDIKDNDTVHTEKKHKHKKKKHRRSKEERFKECPAKIKEEKANNEDRKPDIETLREKVSSKTSREKIPRSFNEVLIEVTQRELLDKIKKEKNDGILLMSNQIKKEKLDSSGSQVDERNRENDTKQDNNISVKEEKYSAAAQENSADNIKTGTESKKINIKNLKNSAVYEATLKEIAEKEKYRALKYEDGELSPSDASTFTDLDTLDQDSESTRNKKPNLVIRVRNRKRSEYKYEKSSHKSKREKKRRCHHRDEKTQKKHKSSERTRRDSANTSTALYSEIRFVPSQSDTYSEIRRPRSSRSRIKRSKTRSPSKDHRSSSRKRKLSRSKRRSRSRRPSKSRSAKKVRSSSGSRARKHTMSRSPRHKSKSRSPDRIDKQKLLEIARKNALNLLQQGALPASVIVSASKIASIKAGGKTVDELTDFCKKISKKEAEGNISDHEKTVESDDERLRPFHHPFQIKERPSSIVMNIRNSVPLPTKTPQEKTLEMSKQLSIQFPVSSGQQHRVTENVWVPVEPKKEQLVTPKNKTVTTAAFSASNSTNNTTKSLVSYSHPSAYINMSAAKNNSIITPAQGIDIGNIVSQRVEALRRLTENPYDPVGNTIIQTMDSKINLWAESKVQPGLFTGSTGVKTLTAAELSGGIQAWPKKNIFTAAKPVASHKGEALMKKMGWQPGEGLGKYKQGPAAPFSVSLKTDRKGLTEQPVIPTFCQPNTNVPVAPNKHPVSILNEYCSQNKLGVPQYECEEKEGVSKRKLFLFTVTVNGFKYIPSKPSPNKKQSKFEAATLCLQMLGLLPAATI